MAAIVAGPPAAGKQKAAYRPGAAPRGSTLPVGRLCAGHRRPILPIFRAGFGRAIPFPTVEGLARPSVPQARPHFSGEAATSPLFPSSPPRGADWSPVAGRGSVAVQGKE